MRHATTRWERVGVLALLAVLLVALGVWFGLGARGLQARATSPMVVSTAVLERLPAASPTDGAAPSSTPTSDDRAPERAPPARSGTPAVAAAGPRVAVPVGLRATGARATPTPTPEERPSPTAVPAADLGAPMTNSTRVLPPLEAPHGGPSR